jgi:uncharacterized membrane protein
MTNKIKIEEVILGTFSFIALVGGLVFKSRVFSYTAMGLLILCAIFIVGRHIPDFVSLSVDNPKMKTLRFINWFTIGIVILGVALSAAFEKHVLTDLQEKWLSLVLVTLIMVVIGNFAPKIPFNRYIGLRLPWTVRDEETWILAHRILGYITFPLVVCFIVLSQFLDTKTCVMITLLTWILIPGILSGLYFLKKHH